MVVVLRLSTPGDGRILLVRPRVSREIFKVIVVLDGFTVLCYSVNHVVQICRVTITRISFSNNGVLSSVVR